MQRLESLLEEGIIDEVLGRLKSGKEAEVFLVSHRGSVAAAKVYKEVNQRSFRNNAGYKEGRRVRNTRTQRAMDRGSRFGQRSAEEAWKQAEADALFKLHAAGARVPKPLLFYEGVLIMEAVPDAAGNVAPRLIDAPVAPHDAKQLYETLRAEAIRFLCADLIHGDLSPFNVLMAWDGPVVIDFPQVVAAAHNSRAEQFFKRDIESIRRFCAALDPSLNTSAGDADEIWRAYVRRDLTPAFTPTGRQLGAPKPARQQPATGRQGPSPAQRGQQSRDAQARPSRPGASPAQRGHQNRDAQARPSRPGASPAQRGHQNRDAQARPGARKGEAAARAAAAARTSGEARPPGPRRGASESDAPGQRRPPAPAPKAPSGPAVEYRRTASMPPQARSTGPTGGRGGPREQRPSDERRGASPGSGPRGSQTSASAGRGPEKPRHT